MRLITPRGSTKSQAKPPVAVAAEDVVDPRDLSEIDDPHDLPHGDDGAVIFGHKKLIQKVELPLVALGPDSIDQISVDLRRRAIVMSESEKAAQILTLMVKVKRAYVIAEKAERELAAMKMGILVGLGSPTSFDAACKAYTEAAELTQSLETELLDVIDKSSEMLNALADA